MLQRGAEKSGSQVRAKSLADFGASKRKMSREVHIWESWQLVIRCDEGKSISKMT